MMTDKIHPAPQQAPVRSAEVEEAIKAVSEYLNSHSRGISQFEAAILRNYITTLEAQPPAHSPVNTAQPAGSGGWQPIETAPLDGTMILVCLPRMMNLIVRARYNTIHKYWLNDYEGEGGIKTPYFYHPGDLWQPMPVLPTNEKTDA